jgi:putative addiction module component (TIGR02574 family)
VVFSAVSIWRIGMARTIEDIESEIRTLSADDRMHLLRDLIADLDGAIDKDVEKAWLDEAERRHRELKEGTVEPVPAEEVFARARARLNT